MSIPGYVARQNGVRWETEAQGDGRAPDYASLVLCPSIHVRPEAGSLSATRCSVSEGHSRSPSLPRCCLRRINLGPLAFCVFGGFPSSLETLTFQCPCSKPVPTCCGHALVLSVVAGVSGARRGPVLIRVLVLPHMRQERPLRARPRAPGVDRREIPIRTGCALDGWVFRVGTCLKPLQIALTVNY